MLYSKSLNAPTNTHPMALMLASCVYSGKKADCGTALAALQEAKELVTAFQKSSSRVPVAISKMNNTKNGLKPKVSQEQS